MSTPDRTTLRAVLAAGLCGQVAASVAGVLPAVVLPVTAAALVLAARAGLAAPAGRARVLRTTATLAAVALVALVLPRALLSGEDARGLLGPLLVVVQVLHALTWRARRDLAAGLLGAAGLLVLGASYAPDLLVGLPLLAGWAACLVGAQLLVADRTRQDADLVAVTRAAPRRPLLAGTALALVLGLVAFLLVPVPQSAGISNRFGSGGGPGGTRASALSGDRLDLRARGALTETPVLRVPAASPALWRASTYDSYDGTTWASTAPRPRSVAGPSYALGVPSGAVREDDAVPLVPSPVVWTPGRPVALDRVTGAGEAAVTVDDTGEVRLREVPTGYRVRSEEPVLDPAVLRAATTGPGDARWRQLPAALPARVRTLAAQLTEGAPTRLDAVRAVEAWLGANATYRLDSPVPGRGEDAVDRFLFVDRTGFCEQFAAAEVVLLRAAGIPARLVTGLAYGQDTAPGERTYRQLDLHAWAEVDYGDLGWQPSDPTAGAVLESSGRSLRSRLNAPLARAAQAVDDVPGGRPAVAVALLGAVLLVALARRRGPRTPAAAGVPVTAGPALAAFLRLDARLGLGRRRPSESLEEMTTRLALAGAEADAFATVQQECYAPVRPDADGAVRVLDRL